jgi:NhaA family Na+:H+ antiporter
MRVIKRKLSETFKTFFASEKASGFLLFLCTVVSLWLANSVVAQSYLSIWQRHFAGLSVERLINDALMAVFFLLIGLELKRELYDGELSNVKTALLPIFAALGGICCLLLFISL